MHYPSDRAGARVSVRDLRAGKGVCDPILRREANRGGYHPGGDPEAEGHRAGLSLRIKAGGGQAEAQPRRGVGQGGGQAGAAGKWREKSLAYPERVE